MERKELLKKIVLDNSRYDIEIYRIIDSGVLDLIIPKLKENQIIYNKENRSVDFNEHIIMLLNNFVHFLKSNFKEICPFFEYILKRLIKENISLFLNYLSEDKYVNCSENFDYYELWNYKLSISNFIKNTYFSSVKKLFDDNNISVKEINKYSNREIKNIFDLLKSIANHSTIDIALPFDNVYKYINNSNISESIRANIFVKFDELFNELYKSYNLNNSRYN